MDNLSEIEKRLSEIKWCAQKICELIRLEPRINRFAEICSLIEAKILPDRMIMNTEAKPPAIENKDQPKQ